MRLCTILLICFLPFLAFSQKKEKFKFKKVSKELLQQAEHELHPDAVAAYDQNRCNIFFGYKQNKGFVLTTEIINRIKIYKEGGKDYGNIEFYLYNNSGSQEEVAKMEAFTYNMVDGEIKKTKIEKSDIFKNRVNDFYESYNVAMPNVQVGSVLEIKYVIESPFYYSIDPFYMQKSVPVNNLYYKSEFPEYYTYNPNVRGALQLELKKQKGNGKVTLDQGETASFLTQDWIFEQENIPPILEEEYVYNMKNYMSSVSWELSSTKFPGSFVKQYSTTWDKVATQLSERESFGKYLRANNREIKDIVEYVTSLPEDEKMKSIYEYVNTNYKWNENNSALGGNMKTVVKDKTGSSGQINLLLINLLNRCGIPALPVVLKTRNQGYLNYTFPTISELNYVIAGIQTSKGMMFLDASIPLLPMGSLPFKAINLYGVVIDGNKGMKIDITSPNKTQYTHFLSLELVDDSKLVGTRASAYYNYSSYRERAKYKSFKTEEAYFAKKGEEAEKVVCSDMSIENIEEVVKPVKFTSNVDYSDYIQQIDGKIFIPTLLDFGLVENPFREGERTYNLSFNTMHSSKVIMNYKIPDGYEVESSPEPISMALPDKSVTFKFNVTILNNMVNVTSFIDRKTDNIAFDLYPGLREIYGEVMKKSAEQIVLVKK